MALRSTWTGSISFGLVNVPVKLYTAVQSKDIRFNEMEEGTGAKVRHRRVAGEDDHEVPYEKIVKGFEVHSGEYVLIEPAELDAIAPGRSKTIDIEDFVALSDIDPVYFEKAYYLGPQGGTGAAKPYELLRRALEESGRIAIGRFVMRSKQRLAAIRPSGDVLMLETLYFPDEVRDAGLIEDLPDKEIKVTARELDMANMLIDSMTTQWDPERYHDTYREKVEELIEQKARGERISIEAAEPAPAVIDLMAALEASVDAVRSGRRADGDGDGSSAKGSRARSTKGAAKGTKAKTSSSRRRADGDTADDDAEEPAQGTRRRRKAS